MKSATSRALIESHASSATRLSAISSSLGSSAGPPPGASAVCLLCRILFAASQQSVYSCSLASNFAFRCAGRRAGFFDLR